MRGKPGTKIQLTVLREGSNRPFNVTLERAVIRIASIKSEALEEGFGYIRVTQFQGGTATALRRAIGELQQNAGGKLKGLVLDLRNNPGGILDGAVEVADTFLRDGVIVSTRGRDPESEIRYSATPKDFLDDAPIVVLVNGGSASASEIVAGALQDHSRAIIMGSPTFGKGSVQTILPMVNGAALKITTARYYTPGGRSIQALGIEPDIVSSNLVIGEQGDNADDLREADLAGHLENGEAGPPPDADEEPDQGDQPDGQPGNQAEEHIQDRDYQVREALNLLKGMTIARNRRS
jgi:carboxyl-terminal processing protease